MPFLNVHKFPGAPPSPSIWSSIEIARRSTEGPVLAKDFCARRDPQQVFRSLSVLVYVSWCYKLELLMLGL
jgi:hypothetical protein